MATEAWTGGRASTRAICLLCPNPGPMTLDGTNTWVLGPEGADELVVVDPGPLDEVHLQSVLAYVAGRGARVALTLLTHRHFDHAESAERWSELTEAPVRGAGYGEPLTDNERITVGDLELRALLTPGHTSDSVSFVLPADRLLLTGDMVLGRGSSVVAHPDGNVSDYLTSLERMLALTQAEVDTIAPGHGPVLPDAAAVLGHYHSHRLQRLEQVRAALAGQAAVSAAGGASGAPTDELVEAVVGQVYAEVPRDVWPAARLTVRAQLDYLAADA